jgi:hypothetical protein
MLPSFRFNFISEAIASMELSNYLSTDTVMDIEMPYRIPKESLHINLKRVVDPDSVGFSAMSDPDPALTFLIRKSVWNFFVYFFFKIVLFPVFDYILVHISLQNL